MAVFYKQCNFSAIFCLQVDSKKELEKQVKASCEAFIMAVTKLTVEPMLSFITKVTAVKVATSLANSKRLREQVCVFSSVLCRTGCSMCEFDPGSQLRSRASYSSGNAWSLRCYKLYAVSFEQCHA